MRHLSPVFVTLLLLAAGCAGEPERLPIPAAPDSDRGKLLAYLKILAADSEPVGFVERRQQLSDEGVPVEIDYVKRWSDFAVRGYIFGNGRAVKHVIIPPGLRKAEGGATRDDVLPESDRDVQIARILDLPRKRAPFKLVPVTDEDIRRTTPVEPPRR